MTTSLDLNLPDELLRILNDYALDLSMVQKRDGKLPAEAAVARLTDVVLKARVDEVQHLGGSTMHAQFCEVKGKQFKKCIQCLKDDRITALHTSMPRRIEVV